VFLAFASRLHTSENSLSSILYYITGHGYGHAVRSAQVIRSLLKARPELKIHARTSAPQWLFPRSVSCSGQSIDVGIVQRDSLDMDLAATVSACRSLYDSADTILSRELAFIREHQVRLIVADIPPLAFEIAARAQIPAVAISNFSWDMIYRAYVHAHPEFMPLIDAMTRCYNKATLLLALPYPCPMAAFSRQEPIPWISRSANLTKQAARKHFDLPHEATIVLLSFGGLGLSRLPWDRLKEHPEYFFVATGEVRKQQGNVLILSDKQRHYENLLRAVDVLVTKPGYGIVADVLRQKVPILYTDRGEFPEYPYLVQALTECATAEYIPQDELLSGNIATYVSGLLRQRRHWPEVALDGAKVAAQKLLQLLD
jgi:L-arabinokinase